MELTEEKRRKIEYFYKKFHSSAISRARKRLYLRSGRYLMDDCEDVVENAFFRLVKYSESIDMNRSDKELCAYLLTIVDREADRLLENKSKYEPLDFEICEDEDALFDSLSSRFDCEAVISAIGRLSDKYRRVLTLYFIDELDADEVADKLSISVKGVYTRLARARRLLRMMLEGEDND